MGMEESSKRCLFVLRVHETEYHSRSAMCPMEADLTLSKARELDDGSKSAIFEPEVGTS